MGVKVRAMPLEFGTSRMVFPLEKLFACTSRFDEPESFSAHCSSSIWRKSGEKQGKAHQSKSLADVGEG